MKTIEEINQINVKKILSEKKIPDFFPGDVVKVGVRITEGKKERIQYFEGVCIAKKSRSINSSFTVRKISFGEGVERTFPLYGTVIDSIKVIRSGKVRRAKEINSVLNEYIVSLMKPLENKSFFEKKEKLNATLVSGVNGVGKTTTIGKIGKILKTNGSKVMFAASDTFRAAAIEQLENWASKVDVQIVKSSQGADPASVAFKAVDEAIKNNFDQVLIDTAGRLQNKKNLMEEYKKIANVTKKIDPNAPHNVILVLDATSGQNVLNQVEEFNKIIPITGIVMTKLDGTAKGGILLALAKKYEIPIIALGLGEKEDDLQLFEAEKFAEAFTQIN